MLRLRKKVGLTVLLWLLVFLLGNFQLIASPKENVETETVSSEAVSEEKQVISPDHVLAKELIPRKIKDVSKKANEDYNFRSSLGPYEIKFNDKAKQGTSVRLGLDGKYLAFSLRGGENITPSVQQNSLSFVISKTLQVNYSLVKDGVKEKIIFKAKPKKASLVFDFTSEGLDRRQESDGYHFIDEKGEEIFWIPKPTVTDANNNPGKVELDITGQVATLKIDKAFLNQATYPVVIDPTIVATSTSARATGLSINRHIVRTSNGTLVLFYQSGGGIQYKTSTDDGVTWSDPVTVTPGTRAEFAVWIDTADNIYIVYYHNGTNAYIFFRKLTYSGGSWSIGAERVVESGGIQRRYPSLVREDTGRIWVTYRYRRGFFTSYSIRVKYSDDEGQTWSASTQLATTNRYGSSTLIIYGGFPAVFFEVNDNSLQWRTWNGSDWSPAATIVSGDDYDDYNWGSLTVTSDNRIHLVYSKYGGGYIRHTAYDGSSWSAPLSLSSDKGDRYPNLTTDGTNLWAIWSQYVGSNQYKLVYKKYDGTAWDTNPTVLTPSSERPFDQAWTYSLQPYYIYTETLIANEFTEAGTRQGWRADDRSWLYNLPFPFPFYGTTYTSVYVSSNGFLDFTSSNADYSNSTSELIGRVMIAPLWDDLRTNGRAQQREDIYIYQPDGNSVSIRWKAETYWGAYPVNVEVVLYSDGRIKFNYGSGNTNLTPTIGISRGNGTDFLISTYNEASVLTNVQTSLIAPGETSNWKDVTTPAADDSTGDVPIFTNNGDELYVGLSEPFDYVYFLLSTSASSDISPTWEYWNGSAWQTLEITKNPTYDFTSSGRIEFIPPSDWQLTSVNGSENLYYLKVKRTATSVTTTPIASQITAVRNNIYATTILKENTVIPIAWTEGLTSPYNVKFDSISLANITFTIDETYDLDGTPHTNPPYSVNFTSMDPAVALSYVIREGSGLYAVKLTVISNVPWDLFVQASDDLKDEGGNTIPISNLKWAPDESGTWRSFVKAPAMDAVLSNQPITPPEGKSFTYDYQLNITWETAGGTTFTTNITYTALQSP
jgi:hypothetical protein